MNTMIQMPAWLALLFAGIFIFIMVLDGWRAKMWTKYVEAVRDILKEKK